MRTMTAQARAVAQAPCDNATPTLSDAPGAPTAPYTSSTPLPTPADPMATAPMDPALRRAKALRIALQLKRAAAQ